jgi:hypothetical protein
MLAFNASTASCRDNIIALINAHAKLVAGEQRVRVRFNDRWTEYGPGSVTFLEQTINLWQAQCPDADQAGLIQMNPGLRARRGRPARIRIY